MKDFSSSSPLLFTCEGSELLRVSIRAIVGVIYTGDSQGGSGLQGGAWCGHLIQGSPLPARWVLAGGLAPWQMVIFKPILHFPPYQRRNVGRLQAFTVQAFGSPGGGACANRGVQACSTLSAKVSVTCRGEIPWSSRKREPRRLHRRRAKGLASSRPRCLQTRP